MPGVNSKRLNGSKRTLLSYILVFFITILSFGWRQPLYAPLTEGWWHVYSRWLSEGLIPYKDFNLIVPPGMPYLNWFITSIIGENFLDVGGSNLNGWARDGGTIYGQGHGHSPLAQAGAGRAL
jgi:hypothetical protein